MTNTSSFPWSAMSMRRCSRIHRQRSGYGRTIFFFKPPISARCDFGLRARRRHSARHGESPASRSRSARAARLCRGVRLSQRSPDDLGIDPDAAHVAVASRRLSGDGQRERSCHSAERRRRLWREDRPEMTRKSSSPVLAKRLRRPVCWIEERSEYFLAGGHARETRINFEVGYTRAGRHLRIEGGHRCRCSACRKARGTNPM